MGEKCTRINVRVSARPQDLVIVLSSPKLDKVRVSSSIG